MQKFNFFGKKTKRTASEARICIKYSKSSENCQKYLPKSSNLKNVKSNICSKIHKYTKKVSSD